MIIKYYYRILKVHPIYTVCIIYQDPHQPFSHEISALDTTLRTVESDVLQMPPIVFLIPQILLIKPQKLKLLSLLKYVYLIKFLRGDSLCS